jgi:hypothetical protein
MPTISTIPSPFKRVMYSLHSLVSGGFCSQVDFEGKLTASELEYCKLVARTDFFQLVRTAIYMNEGLSFRDATIKYLKAMKEAKSKSH